MNKTDYTQSWWWQSSFLHSHLTTSQSLSSCPGATRRALPWSETGAREVWHYPCETSHISHLKLKYFDKTIFCYWQLAWLQRKIFRNKSKILNLILNLRWEGKGRNKNHDILIVAQEVWKESSDQVKRSGQGTAEYQSAISPGYLYILMWWRGHKYLPGAEWWVVTLGKVSTAENNDEYNDVAAILLF